MENKNLKLLFVGLGVIADEWLEALRQRDDITIVGVVVRKNGDAAKEKLASFGYESPVYTDFDTALAETKPDVVCDLAYAMQHREITLKSFAAGCSVFGEKPMCMTYEEGLELLIAAKESGLAFNIMENRRYLKGTRALRHAVTSGLLGDVWNVCCELYVNSDLRSVRNTLPYPMLQDQAIHSFDTARFILNANAVNVYCHSYNPKGSHYNGDGSGACIFGMSDGSVLTYNAVMDTNVMKTAWHSQWRVIGSKGTAFWNGFDALPQAELLQDDGSIVKCELEVPADWNGIEWFSGAIDEMISSLREGREADSSCFDNFESMKMMFGALRSAQSHRCEIIP